MKSKEKIDSSVDSGDEPTPGIITETVGSYTDEAGNKVRKFRVDREYTRPCGEYTLVSGKMTRNDEKG